MKADLLKKINIFLTVDLQTISTYFNTHDPAPLYKRQLNQQFEQYILKTMDAALKYSVVFYKLKCTNEIDKQYAEPLMYAVKRHFKMKKEIRIDEFNRFKRQTFTWLIISLIIIVLCHGVIPFVLNSTNRVESLIMTSADIFSWVVLWRPIDKLVFEWQPHLRDIRMLDKLATAEMMIIQTKKETGRKENILFAMPQTG